MLIDALSQEDLIAQIASDAVRILRKTVREVDQRKIIEMTAQMGIQGTWGHNIGSLFMSDWFKYRVFTAVLMAWDNKPVCPEPKHFSSEQCMVIEMPAITKRKRAA